MDKRLAIAGKQLLKGNFGNAVAAMAKKSVQSQLIQPGKYLRGNFFFGVNGADKAFIWGNYNSSLTAYQQCPIVSSIINKQAQCLVNGKRYVLDAQDNEAKSKQAIAVQKLLDKPNPFQNGKQFRAQNRVYRRIYGYCPVLKIIPVGYESDHSKWRLWNIPPWMLQILDHDDFFFLKTDQPFKSIRLTYLGYSIEIPQDKIFFIKENQISTNIFQANSQSENVSIHLPDSRVSLLKENINNLVASLEGRGSLIVQRGPLWILSNDANDSGDQGLFPIDPDAKKDLDKDFIQYGITRRQTKAIITDAKLKLQTVGFDVGQLKLLEGEVQDAKFISDGLNHPPYLMGLIDAKFDNQQIAERSLYTNEVIPDADNEDEQLTDELNIEDLGLKLWTDFSHVPALQEDIAEQGKGRWYMNQALLIEWLQDGITWNRWRELLGEDQVSGMDKFYSELVKEGRILPQATAQAISSAANNIIAQTNPANNNSSNNNSNNNG